MDSIITTKGFLYLINQFLDSKYQEAESQREYFRKNFPNKEEFFDWFLSQNIYDYCQMAPDTYEVIRELNEYYNIFIATSYISQESIEKSGDILKQKFDYLNTKLPFINPYNYIFITDKSIINIPIKIDNKIETLQNPNDERKLLFNNYHNLNIPKQTLIKNNIERVENWEKVKVKLLKK